MLIELTAQEREVLETLVARELAELGPEIHHTRARDYREELKTRRRVLEDLLARLSRPGEGRPSPEVASSSADLSAKSLIA